ncbi:MAG TPA: alanine racemase, partial [Flavobacteriales bacterium]|nr:alanine racemase [Flavobacteriales bacterium]
AVAYPDEGRELREKGIQLPIMVMNAEPASFDVVIRNNLEPEIYSLKMLNQFELALQMFGGDKREVGYPVHIKLDSGMHRLGFANDEIEELGKRLKSSKLFEVKSIFSHLAASDSEKHDEFSSSQIKTFSEASDALIASLRYKPLRHILNSAGVVRFPENQFDMVRLGIGLYGVDTSGEIQDKLENVSTLRSCISQVKTINPGETIGYNRQFKATKKMKIGIVGIGYADGLNRLWGNGKGYVKVKQSKAPIVGDICMDMCMIDITGIRNVQEGEPVVIFSEEPSVAEIAKAINTIPYEILTSISQRVNRVYFYE